MNSDSDVDFGYAALAGDAPSDLESDVDMSWVELAMSDVASQKRRLSMTPEDETKLKKAKSAMDEEQVRLQERVTARGALEMVYGSTTDEVATQSEASVNPNVIVRVFASDAGETIIPAQEGLRGRDVVEMAPSTASTRTAAPHTGRSTRARITVLTDLQGNLLKKKSGARPYSEPPQFDYDSFEREYVASDKKLLAMFPNDPQGRTTYRDVKTEAELLEMYASWTSANQDWDWTGKADNFHSDLSQEIKTDLEEISDELNTVNNALTDLQVWQETNLSMDGGELDGVRERLAAGKKVFEDARGGTEAQVMYQYLLDEMPRYPSDDLATWEYFHLGVNGTIARRNKPLRDCRDLLWGEYYGSAEASKKYGYSFEKTVRKLDEKCIDGVLELKLDLAGGTVDANHHADEITMVPQLAVPTISTICPSPEGARTPEAV